MACKNMASLLLFFLLLKSSLGLKLEKHDLFEHKRPLNGIGPIEISKDYKIMSSNFSRLLIVFDKECDSYSDVSLFY